MQAAARLVGEHEYGDAACAAIFSNLKLSGMLPPEGAIPASVTFARQQLLSAIRTRVEELVGEERLQGRCGPRSGNWPRRSSPLTSPWAR
eukprot:5059221-Pleurochrysis_carterae.AAC.1